MCVIDNHATAYVLSAASAFKWDTCAPHAILRALGMVHVLVRVVLPVGPPEEESTLPNQRDGKMSSYCGFMLGIRVRTSRTCLSNTLK